MNTRPGVDDIQQLLSQNPVFSVLHEGELQKLASRVRLNTFEPGQFIVRQGGVGHSLFIIQEGNCEVFAEDEQGFVKTVTKMSRGDFFGEMSLLTGADPAATVRAVEQTTLVVINKDMFASIVKENKQLSKTLGEILEKRQKQLAALTGRSPAKKYNATGISSRIKSFFGR